MSGEAEPDTFGDDARSGAIGAGLDGVVDFPWEVLEYLAWLRQQPSSRSQEQSYLFDAPEVRFRPAETDLLLSEPGLVVEAAAEGLRLRSGSGGAEVSLPDVDRGARPALQVLLRRLDGQQPLAALRSGLPPSSGVLLDQLLDAAFGKLIFAPLALAEVERAISGIEIVRFPGSPYEIARPYWRNMGAVRARADAVLSTLDDDGRFARELRRLHVVALMGEDLQSYYQPASPISSGRAAPGRFMLNGAVRVTTPAEHVFVSGPRVSAAFAGGVRYNELLYESLGEPEAALPRHFRSSTGLDWGQIVVARAPGDATALPWYCPPRPLRRAHLRALRESLAAAKAAAAAAEQRACAAALAAFHQDFVRLHPFHCGNQSLAMNLVNTLARRAFGAGIPHLLLDHLAVRLTPEAYSRAFQRALAGHVDPQPNPAARYLRAAARRTGAVELLQKLDAAPSLEAARSLARARPEAARVLLLEPLAAPPAP